MARIARNLLVIGAVVSLPFLLQQVVRAMGPRPRPGDPPVFNLAECPLLGIGNAGEPVQNVQFALWWLNHDLAIDGIFGPETDAQVRLFQQRQGLPEDGIVGPETYQALHAALAEHGGAFVCGEFV
jgi:hypothetical protein